MTEQTEPTAESDDTGQVAPGSDSGADGAAAGTTGEDAAAGPAAPEDDDGEPDAAPVDEAPTSQQISQLRLTIASYEALGRDINAEQAAELQGYREKLARWTA